jgi:AcrR family transcriptional regulator
VDAPRTRLPREERRRIVLDTAQRLFYARGVHEVGMDELVAATGLGKATVYRLFPTKEALVGEYLQRLSAQILDAVDAGSAAAAGPAEALHRVLDAVEADLRRPGFRGCPFHNAGTEFPDPQHAARRMAREYREALHARLVALAGDTTGAQLAVLVDGAYTSAAHLGADGPAAAGLALARALVDGAVG